MRHRAQLEERLGPLVLAKLFELVADGSIERGSLERMSFSQNMDVVRTYSQCMRDRESPERTLERMLEEWYEEKVCSLSPSEAVKELKRILEVTCPTSVCERLGLVHNTGTTDTEEEEDTEGESVQS